MTLRTGDLAWDQMLRVLCVRREEAQEAGVAVVSETDGSLVIECCPLERSSVEALTLCAVTVFGIDGVAVVFELDSTAPARRLVLCLEVLGLPIVRWLEQVAVRGAQPRSAVRILRASRSMLTLTLLHSRLSDLGSHGPSQCKAPRRVRMKPWVVRYDQSRWAWTLCRCPIFCSGKKVVRSNASRC